MFQYQGFSVHAISKYLPNTGPVLSVRTDIMHAWQMPSEGQIRSSRTSEWQVMSVKGHQSPHLLVSHVASLTHLTCLSQVSDYVKTCTDFHSSVAGRKTS
jgi:hypothetical protein